MVQFIFIILSNHFCLAKNMHIFVIKITNIMYMILKQKMVERLNFNLALQPD